MTSDPAAVNGYLPEPFLKPVTADYERLRDELERLMAEPVKDFPRIDQLVDDLELLQLAIKEAHGVKGNNPNE
ncbi:MAG: hypothetical protein ACWA6Y_03465 [Polaromonas sp.]